MPTLPRRSVLYLPASNARALEKARELEADALIIDLEDAVAPEAKPRAREMATEAIRAGYPGKEVALRVNAADTPWGDADLEAAYRCGPDAIVLPKVETAQEVREVALGIPLWAMIETPRGVLAAHEIAAAPGVAALVMGTSDLVRDLRARPVPGRENLLYALSRVVTCARAHGLEALDGVHLDLEDAEGFERACVQGRDLGFGGKTLIHPRQIETANRVFGVSPEEVAWARRVLEAYRAARAEGKGVAVLDGRLIENLHAAEAERLLELDRVIRERGT
ncbi:citrate lyase subunit beta/citryl-CoA lyase [Deinobacterium chartae]|uniref:Citrate lyase subunit beta/citryl-CoA lyase n=1 Tax=Deinobacterium chartae TaxID=521158 RepID=A0A841I1S9_9DEIO|nr:CoA ester lyase [Deinobacterium chartae]MBB6098349.1 citrate lyase subunit beta/citryl-CoA lyase [Deinobacterium chartae]